MSRRANKITAANAGKRFGFAGKSRVGLSPDPGVAEFHRSAAFATMQLIRSILVVAATTLSIGTGCSSSSKSEVPKLLAEAKLSPLPPSATNVAYYQWNGLFTGETYAKFELSPGDLRTFISNSPSLQGIEPKKIYNTNYQHVPFPPLGGQWDLEHCDYFSQHPKFPSWYDLTVPGKGRKYVSREGVGS
jgi:hypothetical protein